MEEMALNCLALTVICLLYFPIADSSVSHEDDSDNGTRIVIKVGNTNHYELRSPGFPRCCEPVKYLLTKAFDHTRLHWKLLFTDLDLPLTSELLIYGIKHQDKMKQPIDSARYYEGAWIRPVVVYDGYAVLIEFAPLTALHHDQNTNKQMRTSNTTNYVGFKIIYWLNHDQWNIDKPYTSCPQVENTYDGGELIVGDLDTHLDRQQYKMHCIWQLKPVPQSDLEVYIKLEKLSGSDSMVKIREGLTSDDQLRLSKSVLNNPERITSKKGFYIELSKPSEGSQFEMSYGVQKHLAKRENCIFLVDSITTEGFRCEEDDSEDLCIPYESVCDHISNCPSGFDETYDACLEKPITFTTTRSPLSSKEICYFGRCNDGRCPENARQRCPEFDCPPYTRRCQGTLICAKNIRESCPGETCTNYEKTCADNSCVPKNAACLDKSKGCSYTQKRCQDGRCIEKYNRCPEDPCDNPQHHKCDGKCVYQFQLCNGFYECDDKSDEENCPTKKPEDLYEYGNGSSSTFQWLYLSFFCIAVPFICCCGYRLKKSLKKEKRTNQERSGEEGRELNQIDRDNERNNARDNTSARNQARGTPQPNEATSLINPIVAPSVPSTPSPSPPQESGATSNLTEEVPAAPPAYGDIMHEVFHPPEPPPAYSELDHVLVADSSQVGPESEPGPAVKV